MLLKATLEIRGESYPVILRNLSEDGALVSSFKLPDEGSHVLFHRQGLSVPGRIAWVHCNHAGLAFDFSLFPRELLRHIPPKTAKEPLPLKRRPGLRSKPLTEGERRIIEIWAADSPFALGD